MCFVVYPVQSLKAESIDLLRLMDYNNIYKLSKLISPYDFVQSITCKY